MSFRLSDIELRQLLADYERGATGRQLAEQYGIARSTVIQLVKDQGIATRHPRMSSGECAQAVELHRQGVRQIDIAEQFGRHKSVIWHVLRRAGVASTDVVFDPPAEQRGVEM